jgi:hypothetical protein
MRKMHKMRGKKGKGSMKTGGKVRTPFMKRITGGKGRY